MTILMTLGLPFLASVAYSAASSASCVKVLNETMHNPLLLEQFILATGKNLPYDSGKYAVCNNIETASGLDTKFFIVNFVLGSGKAALPGEMGVCLPAVCEDQDFQKLLAILPFWKPGIAKNIQLTKQDYPNPFNVKDDRLAWGNGTSFGVCIALALVVMVCWSTFMVTNYIARARAAASHPPEVTLLQDADVPAAAPPRGAVELPRKLALCEAFSLFGPNGSWTTLWKAEKRRPTDCLDGFRVLSMLFIILGHGMLEAMHIAGYSNSECLVKSPLCLNAVSTSFWSYGLLAGQLGVDTFFYIGGFLLSFIGKGRSTPVFLGTALRYARLLPLFAFIQMFYILISPYLAFGPFAPRFQNEVYTECGGSNSWWSELLFINAWYPWYPKDGGCMGWSWYLGVDMTFAILGLIILNIWKKSAKLGWATAIVLFIGCIAVTMQQSLYYNLQYNILSPTFTAYGVQLYSRAYSRFPCFLIGLCAPWALDLLEKRGIHRGTAPQTFAAKAVVFLFSVIAFAVAMFCIFMPYTNAAGPGPYANADGSCSHAGGCARPALQWSYLGSALWISCSRPLWCCSWLIWTLGCYFGYMPIVSAIFGAPIMTPLANLTFGAYLVHPIIIKIISGNVDGYFNYSAIDAIQRAILFAILAYSSSIVTWCLVEKPFANVCGWLVPKKKKAAAAPKTDRPAEDAPAASQQS